MADRPRRKIPRKLPEDANFIAPKVFPNDPLLPATAKDRHEWKGFCEIESEPVDTSIRDNSLKLLMKCKAYFNTMLRDFGVKGVKVQEVVSLDQQFLAFLP